MIALSRQKIIIMLLAVLELLLIPIILWLADWQWQLDETFDNVDQVLFWITESGSAIIYAALTSLFLVLILSVFARQTPWIIIVFTALFLLMSTQIIKTGLKVFYKEPRPYTGYLIEQGVNLDHFYQEKRSVRKELVISAVEDNATMPQYLKNHWSKEVGYSFPSGHTAFAMTWLMMFILILPMNRKRDWVLFSIVYAWTALMMISRIRFGMHYPIDVFVSTLYVPIVCVIYAKLTQHTKFTPNQLFSYVTRR